MGNFNILESIKSYKSVSIIGMDKNVGKTTVLNHILSKAWGSLTLGVTSIGRDGEEKDRVTSTEKPKIYIRNGTYIATARECLFKGDITREIIEATGIHTPMGEVIIAKALSDGFVELGGPSINASMKEICHKLSLLGGELVLVDGALSRRTTASPDVTEACILSTGASLNRSMDKVVQMTSHVVKCLSLEREEDEGILSIVNNQLSAKVAIIYKDKSFKALEAETSLTAGKRIVENLSTEVAYVAVKGVITDGFIEDITKSTDLYRNVVFLIEDGTKLFISSDNLSKFEKLGGRFKVMGRVNLVCVTCNPKSPYGYDFDRGMLLEKLRHSIALPIIDVIGG